MFRYLAPVVALSMVIAAACSPATDRSLDTAAASATPSVSPAPSPALNDPTIVAIFDEANTADIETGQLAADRASTKAVRDFGAMLVRDHTAVRQQGRDLAAKLGVTPTPPVDDSSTRAHADAMAALQSKQGEEFDRAFLEHEVKFHQDVINALDGTLLPAIQNAEVKSFVEKIVPAFQAHMLAAQNLLKQ